MSPIFNLVSLVVGYLFGAGFALFLLWDQMYDLVKKNNRLQEKIQLLNQINNLPDSLKYKMNWTVNGSDKIHSKELQIPIRHHINTRKAYHDFINDPNK